MSGSVAKVVRAGCVLLALAGAILPFLGGFPLDVHPALADRQSWDKGLATPGITGVGNVGPVVVAGDGTIFAVGSAGNLVFKSTTSGSSFSNGVSPDGAGGAVGALAVSPNFATDGSVMAAIGRQVYLSQDYGVTWAAGPALVGAAGDSIASLAVAPNFSSNGQIAVGLRTAGAANGVFHADKSGAWGGWIGAGPAQAAGDATLAVGYSPNWANDTTVTIVTAVAAAGTHLRTGAAWADFPIAGAGNQVHAGAAMRAAIGFPADYAPASSDNLFVATSGAAASSVFRKQGGAWVSASPQGAAPTPSLSIAVGGPYSSATVLVGEAGQPRIWKSTNGGVSWTNSPAVLFGTGGPSYVAVSPSFLSDGTAYAGSAGANGGFLVSTAGGGSSAGWAGIGLYRDAYDTITGLALVPGYPAAPVVFIAESGPGGASGVFRTAAPWKKVAASTVPSSIAVSPNFASDRTVYIVTGPTGIAKSANGGQSFSDSQTTDIPSGTVIAGNALAVGDANKVFVAASQGRLHVSGDSGQTWATRQLGLSVITQVAVSPGFSSDGSIIVGGRTSNGAAVYLSVDGGATFSALGVHPATEGVTSVSAAFSSDYASDRTVYSGVVGSPVRDVYRWTVGSSTAWRRLDAGASVLPGATASPGQAISIAGVASANGALYAAATIPGDGVRRALRPAADYDGSPASWLGLGWAPRATAPAYVSGDPARGRLVGGALGAGTVFGGPGLLAVSGSAGVTYIVAVDTATGTLFSYEDALIRPPVPVFPADGAALERHPGALGGAPAQVQADEASPGVFYQFEVSSDPGFNDPAGTVQSAVLTTPNCDLSGLGLAFSAGDAYYWRARVTDTATVRNATPWSAARRYMAASGAVSLLYPTSAPGRIQSVESLNPAFTWQAAINATGYEIEVSDAPSAEASTGSYLKTVVSQSVTTTSWQSTGTEFKGDTVYYWHVRPVFGESKGKWSNTSAQAGASGVFRTPPAAAKPATPAVADALKPVADKLVVVWGYDEARQAMVFYDPKAPASVSDLKEFTRGQGYFIQVTGATKLVYGGNSYNLMPGFNLIGWLG